MKRRAQRYTHSVCPRCCRWPHSVHLDLHRASRGEIREQGCSDSLLDENKRLKRLWNPSPRLISDFSQQQPSQPALRFIIYSCPMRTQLIISQRSCSPVNDQRHGHFPPLQNTISLHRNRADGGLPPRWRHRGQNGTRGTSRKQQLDALNPTGPRHHIACAAGSGLRLPANVQNSQPDTEH